MTERGSIAWLVFFLAVGVSLFTGLLVGLTVGGMLGECATTNPPMSENGDG